MIVRMISLFIITLTAVMLVSCSPASDPSKRELRSPCTSNGDSANDPCLKRPVVGNIPYLA